MRCLAPFLSSRGLSFPALSVVLLCGLASPATAQKVYVDYDRQADFDSYTSFAWLNTRDTQVDDPLAHSVIKNALEHYMTASGLIEDNESPDLYITYHGEEKTEYSVNTSSYGYGYGGGWYYDPFWGRRMGMGGTTSSVSTYQKGTLVVDIYDAREQQVIWRGKAVGTIPENPSKATKKLEKALDKMVQKWEKMKKNM